MVPVDADARRPRSPTTIVVVPRETFSRALDTLDRLLTVTPEPRRMVYVDGGSPEPIARELHARAVRHDFALVRSEVTLSPNVARNLALPYVDHDGEFVAFVDNDALVEPGWLDALETCARDTGAWVVGPLYCMGDPPATIAHFAGGDASIDEVDGRIVFSESRVGKGEPFEAVRGRDTRHRCGMFEFHAALFRTDRADVWAPFDEGLPSLLEHVDASLVITRNGGAVWHEPSSIVTYWYPRRLTRDDADFYFVRWSDDWGRRSIEHFRSKWGLAPDDPGLRLATGFVVWQRSLGYGGRRAPWTRWRFRRGEVPVTVRDRMVQAAARRRRDRRAASAGVPVLAHAPTWMPAVGSRDA
jgi:glycosyltransferase involved in cell wall biosynthesis